MDEEEIQQKKVELRKKVDELEKQRMELLLEQGKAFRCKKCHTITMKNSFNEEEQKEQLCWIHLEEKKTELLKKEYFEKLKDAKLTDIELEDHWGGITTLILEKENKRYTFSSDKDEEVSWIEFEKEEEI